MDDFFLLYDDSGMFPSMPFAGLEKNRYGTKLYDSRTD